jgi:shikimate kinase
VVVASTLKEWISLVDARLHTALSDEAARLASNPAPLLPNATAVVLVGQRAAGKSTVLPVVAALLNRRGFDLDHEIEWWWNRPVRDWVAADEADFRRCEREAFGRLPVYAVVAVGGGFWAHHAQALKGAVVVEVPISFETYGERLRADSQRPRLLPQVSFEEELRLIFQRRETVHRGLPKISWVDFWFRQHAGFRPKRIVTLPPGAEAAAFAERAHRAGADALEIRTDLTVSTAHVADAADTLPVWVSARGTPVPVHWLTHAAAVDRPNGEGPAAITSFHAAEPLTTAEALAKWESFEGQGLIKHVEPLGPPARFPEVLCTQARLGERFGPHRVTVLVTGPTALPFRCVLARQNAVDYLALDETFSAAPGQRLLEDGVREYGPKVLRAQRLGIIGSDVRHARSPRIHPQPFDRIEWPKDVDIAALLEALRPYYRGLAITHPFKRAVAKALGSALSAVNTLWRDAGHWQGSNTDVEGARVVLAALKAQSVTVLGNGGAADALDLAAAHLQISCRYVRRAEVSAEPLTGACVWTWPSKLEVPKSLRFENATVAVIAYGRAGRIIKEHIVERGGLPVLLGHRWFVAQARGQRARWEL